MGGVLFPFKREEKNNKGLRRDIFSPLQQKMSAGVIYIPQMEEVSFLPLKREGRWWSSFCLGKGKGQCVRVISPPKNSWAVHLSLSCSVCERERSPHKGSRVNVWSFSWSKRKRQLGGGYVLPLQNEERKRGRYGGVLSHSAKGRG